MNDRTNGAPSPTGTEAEEPARTTETASEGGRPRTRAEERIASLGDAQTSLSEEVERLRSELEEARRSAEEARTGWQRSAADLANFRRRAEQERAERLGLANDALLLKVVALADDFDRAMEHVPADAAGSPWLEGIAAIDRKLRALLESEGVTPLETVGQPFDPRDQQAISYEETSEVPEGTVLRELQRGYRIRDRILRPALVAVARNESNDAPSNDET